MVRWSTEWLAGKGIERPRLDAELLLGEVLGLTRLRLYMEFDRPLTDAELGAFRVLLRRRGRREPIQYIFGRTAFRDLELRCDPRALIPRPETEELVEVVLRELRADGVAAGAAVDVGTGTGAIALSLAREGPLTKVVATDRMAPALALARENAALAGISEGGALEFREGDLLAPLFPGERFQAIVSNLPYVGDEEWEGLQPEVRDWEPRSALTAGPGGTALMERLVKDAPGHLVPGGLLALEIGAGQGAFMIGILEASDRWVSPRLLKDLSGRDRFVLARRAEGAEPR
jgi:release factor glutamine methyltransferase